MAGPKVPDELQRFLTKAIEARDELKTATAGAHAARRDLIHSVKESSADVTSQIADEIGRQVDMLAAAAAEDMRSRMREQIDALVEDWRDKLGLSPR